MYLYVFLNLTWININADRLFVNSENIKKRIAICTQETILHFYIDKRYRQCILQNFFVLLKEIDTQLRACCVHPIVITRMHGRYYKYAP